MKSPAQDIHLWDRKTARRASDDWILARRPVIFTSATTLQGMWADTRVRFIRYQGQVYQFNGVNAMRAFTGTGWRNAGIAPYGTLSVVAAGGGTELSGTYQYYMTAANTSVSVGDQRYVESLPIAASTTVTVNAGRVTVTLPSSHPDSQVDKWIIYRNKNGYYDTNFEDDEQDFFKVAEVAIGTTTYTDSTMDDLLPPFPVISFKNELPPAFKFGAIYDNRFFGCGFDEFSTGTVSVDATNPKLLTFSSATMPDGIIGCYFRKSGESRSYLIDSIPSQNQVLLASNFSGQLSASNYVIYRDPSYLYYSEQLNAEAWGLEGELQRNQQPVGGPGSKLKLTGCYAAHGRLYIFTMDQVYVLYSKGDFLSIAPEPLLDGVGCVSGDTVVQVDDTLYWLSLQGPVAYNPSMGSKATRLGGPLGTDWLDALNPAQIGLAAGGYQPLLHTIKWAVPLTGENENGYIYVYDIATNTFWPEEDWSPTLYWQDYDSNGAPRLYSGVGRQFFLEDIGHNDGVPSGTVTGTVSSFSNPVVTVSSATFYTTGYGLEDRWMHFYRTSSNGSSTYIGKSRIDSNTATTVTLEDSVSVVAGDIFFIGPVTFRWVTKTFAQDDKNQRAAFLHALFSLQGESTPNSIFTQDTQDGTLSSMIDEVAINETHKKWPLFEHGPLVSKKLFIRATDAEIAIRGMTLETDVSEKDK